MKQGTITRLGGMRGFFLVCLVGVFTFLTAAETQEIPRPTLFPGSSGTVETSDTDDFSSDESVPAASSHSHYQLDGIASWYGGKFQGRLTANGEIFDTNQLTAAHRELPFGTIVRVTNQSNGKKAVVRINDRGPFVDNRVIDLSRAAADLIDMAGAGLAPVTLEILHYEPESNLRTLQIASFSREDGAVALRTRLDEAGLSPTIEHAEAHGVHRVVIPSIPEPEIENIQRILSGLGIHNPLIRRQ